METTPSSANPFQIVPTMPRFEECSQSNGFRYWWASDLALMLGYDSLLSLRRAVGRAISTLTTLGIDVFENIVQQPREVNGVKFSDYKLSRFACYLVAMNGDPKKPEVASAQAYFITWAEACRVSLQEAEAVERVGIRTEIADHERTLAGTAHAAGVEQYAFFQNAGYRGLYNMDLRRIRQLKGVPGDRSPLDFMGGEELAANLFRVTQTEAKIRMGKIRGQQNLEIAAEDVGRKVRKSMREISGSRPEDLPPAEDIRSVHKKLKSGHRTIKKLDRGSAA